MVSASGTGLQTAQGAVCTIGDLHTCPIPGHGITPLVSGGASKSTVGGKALAVAGSVAGCGAVLNGNFATGASTS